MNYNFASLINGMFELGEDFFNEKKEECKTENISDSETFFLQNDEFYEKLEMEKGNITLKITKNLYIDLDFNTKHDDVLCTYRFFELGDNESVGIILKKENGYRDIFVVFEKQLNVYPKQNNKEILEYIRQDFELVDYYFDEGKLNRSEAQSIKYDYEEFINNKKNVKSDFETFLSEFNIKLHFLMREFADNE